MTLLDKINKVQLGGYSQKDLKDSAKALKSMEPQLAYWTFWQAHLIDTDLENPSKGCDWTIPEYASGIKPWIAICKYNGWEMTKNK